MNKSRRTLVAMSNVLLGLALLAAWTASDAQTVRKRPPAAQAPVPTQRAKDWQEPTGFLGIEFGQPLASQTAVIVECPGKPVSKNMPEVLIYDYTFKGFCYEGKPTDIAKFLPTKNEPDLGVGYQMTLVVKNGDVYGAVLQVGRLSRLDFLALLKSRYGEPHRASVETYRNRVGGQFEGAVYRWEGPTMLLEFSDYAGSTDWAGFSIVRKELSDKEEEQRNLKAQPYKGKL